MTQEQKQFIIKALQSGVPAIAQEHIAALEEVVRVAGAKQEELNGAEGFQALNQEILNVTFKVLQASAPYMAREYINAYASDITACQNKFNENKTAREEKEKAASEESHETPV